MAVVLGVLRIVVVWIYSGRLSRHRDHNLVCAEIEQRRQETAGLHRSLLLAGFCLEERLQLRTGRRQSQTLIN